MKKYLISIEPAESVRLSNFFAQTSFSNEKQNFKIFGVIGNQLSVKDYFRLAVAGKEAALTPGELGCTLSHVKALNDFIDSTEEYAIIFEDDAVERFKIDLMQLEQLIKELNFSECFFLSLGGVQLTVCNRVRGHILNSKLLEQSVIKVDSNFVENLHYTYAYVVDRQMAKKLIDYHQSPHVCDHWQDLVDTEKECTFYATFLFNHPEVEQTVNGNASHLERERAIMKIHEVKKTTFLYYISKKIKKYMLDKYKF